jgi:hypothetical protein
LAEKDDITMPELAGELEANCGARADPTSLSHWLIRNGRNDLSGNLDARRERRFRLALIMTTRHQRIGEIHTRRIDAHKKFVLAKNRIWALDPDHFASLRDLFDDPAAHQRAAAFTISASVATIRSPEQQISGLISMSETAAPASAASSEKRLTISAKSSDIDSGRAAKTIKHRGALELAQLGFHF